MTNPVQWLDKTFSSRERTQELLQPDLESGLLSQHDYQAAVMLYSGTHRYWPYYYSALGSVMGVGWARFIKQPRLSSIGQILAGTSVGWLGALYGKFRRVKLHIQVVKAMENPAAFSQALENISQRIGEPLPPGLKIQVRNDSPKQGSDEFGTLDVQVPTHAIVSRDDRNTNTATQTSASVPNRWEEIRRANAQNAPQSSWEALRRKQERNTPSSDTMTEQVNVIQSDVSDRAQEQAQFDALLEAERRMSRG